MKKKKEIKRKKSNPTGTMEIICFAGPDKQSCEFESFCFSQASSFAPSAGLYYINWGPVKTPAPVCPLYSVLSSSIV